MYSIQCYGAIIPRTESGFERFETEQPRLKAILKTLTKSLKKIDQSQDQRSRESLHQAHSSNVDGLRQLAASGSDLIEDSDEVLQPESKVVQVRPLSSSCMFHTAVPKKAVSVVQNSMQRHENVCEVDDFRDDLEATECFGVEVVLEERECDREETDHGDKICLYHRVCATS